MSKKEIVLDDIRQMVLSFFVSQGIISFTGNIPLALALSVGTGLYYGRKLDLDLRTRLN